MFFFFFFKQKTAYELRISDWSSDVCSSDLCRDDRLILLDRVRREIEAESILLARHPLGERPRLGGGQLQCRGDRYVAAEQAALPRRTFVRRTVGAGEQAFGAGKGARAVGPIGRASGRAREGQEMWMS